ncbi:10340_t:CDS:10, partial [Funneliformis mosseae]
MDAKKERKTTTEKILRKSCNNFLHEYLLQRKNDASFVENSQTEHSWYLAELKEQRRLNVQSAEIAFNTFEVDFQQARVFAGYSCDNPLVQLKTSQHIWKSDKISEWNVYKVKESMNIPDIHEQKGQCTEPIAENNPFFDNNIDDESLNLCDDNSNCEISKVDLDTEKQISPRHSTPSPLSSQPELDFVSRNNHELDSLLDNRHVDCPAIINNHLFKEKSLELANKEDYCGIIAIILILYRSLSHVLLLKPKQHCPLMLEVFSGDLLEIIHKDIIKRFTKQESEFDEKTLIELIRIIKLLQRNEIDRDKAVSELQILAVDRSYGERAILKVIRNIIERVSRITLKSPIGEVELYTTYIDPILCPLFSNPNHAILGLNKGHSEAKVQEEANNLYLFCTDLIRIAVFNKNAIDFYNMNCMLRFQVVEVSHVDAPMSLKEVPTFLTSLDTLLIISNTFWDNCIISTENKEPSRRSTLETPSFKEMVSKKALKKRYDHYRSLNHGDQSLVADDVQKRFQKTFQKKLFEKETE